MYAELNESWSLSNFKKDEKSLEAIVSLCTLLVILNKLELDLAIGLGEGLAIWNPTPHYPDTH